MPQTKQIVAQAKQLFEEYLGKNGYRKTPERLVVIDALYRQDEHLDVDDLYVSMKNEGYSVSRATVYNTLDLLVECGLATKHQFKDKSALYEQALADRHHDHLVCNDCRKIKEFTDEGMDAIADRVGRALGSRITARTLVFYGDCTIQNCENK